MQRLIDLIVNHEVFPRLQLLYPAMVETARDVEVIPWQDEFQVADRNPEVIDAVEFFQMLLKNGLISEQECSESVNKIVSEAGYSSRTEGIAFVEKRQVSFRRARPEIWIVLHELGHVHFQEPDVIWSAQYGGGESLMHLGLFRKFHVEESSVLLYHTLLKDAHQDPEGISRHIAVTVVERTGIRCYPHVAALSLFSGSIPDGLMGVLKETGTVELFSDLNSLEWKKVPVTRRMVLDFLINTVEGLKWGDSFSIAFAKALGLVKNCPTSGKTECTCT